MTITSRLGGIGRALEDRNYRIHTVGYTASWLTFWGQRLATGWVAWELTGSPFLVGVAGFLDLVPVIVLGPLFAALADRLNRLTMVIISAWLGVAQAGLLAALAFSGSMTYASLLVLVLMHGVVIALYMPSFSGLLPHLSSKRNLPAAIAFNSAIGSTAFFCRPGAGHLDDRRRPWLCLCVKRRGLCHLPGFAVSPDGQTRGGDARGAPQPVRRRR